MANQLTVQEQEAIKTLAKQGWKIRRIAKELGLSRNTVRQYVRAMAPTPSTDDLVQRVLNAGAGAEGSVENDPLSTPGKTGRKSLCEKHEELVRDKVQTGLTAQRIFQDLQTEVAFAGSYQSVKRYVGKLRQADPQLVCRLEVQSGEEVQVDFGAGSMLMAEGKKTKTWIFRVVLSHSRKGYTEAVLRQNTETFLRCLENAFLHLGGVSLTVNLDNLKAAVLKFDWADPQFNPKLRDFARHYDTTILPCLPRTPEHKGKVESNIRYVRENALAGRVFTSPGRPQSTPRAVGEERGRRAYSRDDQASSGRGLQGGEALPQAAAELALCLL